MMVCLDLMVLLIHPVSHQFELLPIEFDDAFTATVSDALAKIPCSAKKTCLKSQAYNSLLGMENSDNPSQHQPRVGVGKATKLMDAFRKTKEAFKPFKMAVVARPVGVSNRDILQIAKTIIPSISNLLESNEFDASLWKLLSTSSLEDNSSGLSEGPEQYNPQELDPSDASPAQTIPSIVHERIKIVKWSIDRTYPVLLEQSETVSQQAWIEFCDNFDAWIKLRRWAFLSLGISLAGMITLWSFLYLKWESSISWLDNLAVPIGFVIILPALCYKWHIDGKIQRLCGEFADRNHDLKMIRERSSRFRNWYLTLLLRNMEIDVQDVEYSALESPPPLPSPPPPPKMYCKKENDILYVNEKYQHWRRLQII